MNIQEITVKMARKEGRPNYGSDERAVTLTATLGAGEDHRGAARQLRAEAEAILAGLWHPAAEPTLAQRVTEPTHLVVVPGQDPRPTAPLATAATPVAASPAPPTPAQVAVVSHIAIPNAAVRPGAILTPTTRGLIEAAIHDLKSLTTRPFDERIPDTEEAGRAMARKLRASAHDLRKK